MLDLREALRRCDISGGELWSPTTQVAQRCTSASLLTLSSCDLFRTSRFSYWLFWRSRREMRPTVSPLSSEQTVLDLIKNHTGPTEKHERSSTFSSGFLLCLFSVCFSARLGGLCPSWRGGGVLVVVVVVGLSKKKKSIYLSVLFGQSYSLRWIKAFTKLFVENGDDA